MTDNDLASGLGAAAARQPSALLLNQWAGLAAGTLDFGDFYQTVKNLHQLTYLTIDTTGACDLTCAGMCYYHPAISLTQGPVDEAVLRRAISQARDELSLRVLAFAGKEPFLNAPRLFSLLRYAGEESSRDFSIGVVTNGRHIARHAASIAELVRSHSLDYIDVSIDSADPAEHDLLRGIAGTHKLATDAILWLNRELPEINVTVASVLRSDNSKGILKLIELLGWSNRRFQIQPIQPPPSSPFRPLNAAEVVSFLEDLISQLGSSLRDAKIEVSVELMGIYLLEVARQGIFAWKDIQEDENHVLYVERSIGGNLLIITCEVFPLQAWRLARIRYDGAYLAHMHFLQSPHPNDFAVGFLQTEPITELFDKAINSESHFSKILQSRVSHDCKTRPCWRNCFGGWNGAENSFLEKGRKLSDKPRLCTKQEPDFDSLLSQV